MDSMCMTGTNEITIKLADSFQQAPKEKSRWLEQELLKAFSRKQIGFFVILQLPEYVQRIPAEVNKALIKVNQQLGPFYKIASRQSSRHKWNIYLFLID